jgi:hypothetical protein
VGNDDENQSSQRKKNEETRGTFSLDTRVSARTACLTGTSRRLDPAPGCRAALAVGTLRHLRRLCEVVRGLGRRGRRQLVTSGSGPSNGGSGLARSRSRAQGSQTSRRVQQRPAAAAWRGCPAAIPRRERDDWSWASCAGAQAAVLSRAGAAVP